MSGCSDGHSRQFAFVGFKTTEVAQLALNYFNRSYLDSSRMAIEVRLPPPPPPLFPQQINKLAMHIRRRCKHLSVPLPCATQFAVPHGTEAATRAWSKYTTGTTANARLQAKLQPATKGGSAIVAARPEKKAKKRKNADAGERCACPFCVQLHAAVRNLAKAALRLPVGVAA